MAYFPRAHCSGTAPRYSDENDNTRHQNSRFEDRIIFMSMYNDDIDWSKVEKMSLNVFRTL